MATEVVQTGKKYRILVDAANKIWHVISFWTKGSDVEFNDGDDAETKVGAIKGITTSTSVTTEGYAADATTVSALSENLTANGNILFYDVVEGDGVYINYKDGADTVRKKLGSADLTFITGETKQWHSDSGNYVNCSFTLPNSKYSKYLFIGTLWNSSPDTKNHAMSVTSLQLNGTASVINTEYHNSQGFLQFEAEPNASLSVTMGCSRSGGGYMQTCYSLFGVG